MAKKTAISGDGTGNVACFSARHAALHIVALVGILFSPLTQPLMAQPQNDSQKSFVFYPPDNPPWGSKKTGTGFVIETATEAFERAGLNIEIVYVPWKRAQQQVAETSNGFMGPLTRLPHRERRYQWVAPINISYLQLVTQETAIAKVKWQELLSIPVVARRESPAQFLLEDLNFEYITIVENEIKAARMLQAKRVLIWMQRGLPGNWAYHKVGGQSENLFVVHRWETPLQYLAASPGIDASIVEALANILGEMRVSGEIDSIKERHVPFPVDCDLKFTCQEDQKAGAATILGKGTPVHQ
jgi:polar amino acid transport system substrate-binding protein